MNVHVFIIFFWFFFSHISSYSQKSMEGLVEEMKHYESHSFELKNIVKVFQDTSYSLYGCTDVKKLSMIRTLASDSTELYRIRGTLLIEPGGLTEFKKLGYVVLKVDSISLLLRQDVLLNSPFADSTTYLGEKIFELKYESFESCLHSFGVVDHMIFICLPNGKMLVKSYNSYVPISGQKKLDKWQKRQAKKRKSERKRKTD